MKFRECIVYRRCLLVSTQRVKQNDYFSLTKGHSFIILLSYLLFFESANNCVKQYIGTVGNQRVNYFYYNDWAY